MAAARAAKKSPVRKAAVRRKPRAQHFSVSHLADSRFEAGGLRAYFVYRDLGVARATGGRVGAQVVKAIEAVPKPMGRHRHSLKFQMIYVLKGWAKFEYDGQGVIKLTAGSCVHQPAGIKHEQIACSKDFEVLEITLPAEFATRSAG
jgi:quercetin dioxygenase-like cupin family protein